TVSRNGRISSWWPRSPICLLTMPWRTARSHQMPMYVTSAAFSRYTEASLKPACPSCLRHRIKRAKTSAPRSESSDCSLECVQITMGHAPRIVMLQHVGMCILDQTVAKLTIRQDLLDGRRQRLMVSHLAQQTPVVAHHFSQPTRVR